MKITDTRKKIITYLKTKRWVKEERDKYKKIINSRWSKDWSKPNEL